MTRAGREAYTCLKVNNTLGEEVNCAALMPKHCDIWFGKLDDTTGRYQHVVTIVGYGVEVVSILIYLVMSSFCHFMFYLRRKMERR